jgi:hypothetical protein
MRIGIVITSLVAVVLLATCSGSGGVDTTYMAPDMGSASQLPSGNGTPVPNANAGLVLLQNALTNSGSLVTGSGSSPANEVTTGKNRMLLGPFKGMISNQSTSTARSYTPVTGNVHYTLIPHTGYPGLGVSGSADISLTNWPDSTPANGDLVNASAIISQLLTITADHVSVTPSSTTYTISGKEISNIYISMQEKGTYPALSVSGEFKIGFGVALTVVDTSSGGASAKLILSLSGEGSLTSLSSPPSITGTLYVYDASTNTLIGALSLSGSDLNNILVLVAGF